MVWRGLRGCATVALGVAISGVSGCSNPSRFDEVRGSYRPEEREDGTFVATLRADDDAWRVQERDDYCWAACTQTVLALHGVRDIPTQNQLWARHVASVKPWMPDKQRDAATFQEIRYALAPELQSELDGYVVLDMTDSTGPADLVAELARGQATIVGLRESKESRLGHAYVAYGMRYRVARQLDGRASFEQAGEWVSGLLSNLSGGGAAAGEGPAARTQLEVLEVFLFDPEKPEYGGGHLTLPFGEVREKLDFAISRERAREFLAGQLAVIRRDGTGPGVYLRLTENGRLTSATVRGLTGG